MQTLFSGLAWESRYRMRTVTRRSVPRAGARVVRGPSAAASAAATRSASTFTGWPRLGNCPDVDTYLMIRRGSIGMEPLTSLNDIADGYVLAPDIYHSPLVRALRELCWTLIICDNDLYSYNKESARHTTYFNYINCIAEEQGIRPQQALPHAIALRDRMMCLFLALRDQAISRATSDTRRYLVSLGLWLRANIDWATSSHRYYCDAPEDLYTDRPVDDRLEPPDLPSTTWWWQLLAPRQHHRAPTC
ncbi:terpene synthase family protein [Actinomycetota bacterium Odt1-20B]